MKPLWMALVLLMSSAAFAADPSAAIFRSKCAVCHGPDGKAQTQMAKNLGAPDLTSAKIKALKDADIKAALQNGKGKMPAAKLDPKQLDEMVKYIRSLK